MIVQVRELATLFIAETADELPEETEQPFVLGH